MLSDPRIWGTHLKRREVVMVLKDYVDLRIITAKKVLEAIKNENYNSNFGDKTQQNGLAMNMFPLLR